MEDRLDGKSAMRPGAALIALAAILVITAAWWALALWPVGSAAPEWLTRTRAACFGSGPGGLPDAGGWILLIGEPAGTAAVLWALWGDSLRRNFRWLWDRSFGRIVTAGLAIVILAFAAILGLRVARAQAASDSEALISRGIARRVNRPAPSFPLVDQHNRYTSLADFRGERALLTFAYGHCSTVCPTIINDLRLARRNADSTRVRIVIVTLDPWRDTPERLPTLAAHWRLSPDDLVLSGRVDEVEKTLDALGVGRKRNETTGDIDHAIAVMLLDGRGGVAWRIDGGAIDFANLLRRSR